MSNLGNLLHLEGIGCVPDWPAHLDADAAQHGRHAEALASQGVTQIDLPSRLVGDAPCRDCGTLDNIVWFTDNVLWNHVTGEEVVGTDERDAILCIPCFVKRADAAGLQPTGWRLLADWPWSTSANDASVRAQHTDGPRVNPCYSCGRRAVAVFALCADHTPSLDAAFRQPSCTCTPPEVLADPVWSTLHASDCERAAAATVPSESREGRQFASAVVDEGRPWPAREPVLTEPEELDRG